MSRSTTGGPAFPVPLTSGPLGDVTSATDLAEEGMDLRDYFAAKAMPAHITALGAAQWGSEKECAQAVARLSYLCADAMLKARELWLLDEDETP